MSLYSKPEIYDVLRTPEPEDVELVSRILRAHLDGPLQSIMDPACGPGTWLAPLANGAVRVAGNDLSAEMVGMARARFGERDAEFVLGDMRRLEFRTGPFDVALEVSGAASHLHTVEDLGALLRGMRENVRPGGLVLLNIFFRTDEGRDGEPTVTYQSPARALPSGGRAWITYTFVGRDAAASTETYRRVVRVEGADGMDGGGRAAECVIEDEYALRVWTGDEVGRAMELAGSGREALRLVGVYSVLDGKKVEGSRTGTIPAGVGDEHIVVMKR